MATNSELENLLIESIEEQKRTTHAVRALATYILIQIPYALVAGIIFSLGSSEVGWLIFAGLLAIGGFIHALMVALTELSLSKEDDPIGTGAQWVEGVESSTKRAEGSESDVAASDPDWANDDWVNAKRLLKSDEMKAWRSAGSPSLAKWVSLGKPHFKGWLQNGPF
jgi:hypothetical protein